MHAASHSIRVVAQRTGLSPHVIRVWERRYGVVAPGRTGTNRRRYSDDEVERLSLLRRATEAGHSIGTVATLPNDRIREVLAADQRDQPSGSANETRSDWVGRALETVRRLDGAALEDVLQAGAIELGHQGLLCQLIGPLVHALGEEWQKGQMTAAHEHFASAHIKGFLSRVTRPFAGREDAPRLVVTTPAGQLHELGAIMAASAATNAGWNVTYLGPSLPAAEIAGVVRQCRARAVALSLVYPADCTRLPDELRLLRRILPLDVAMLIGGRAAANYQSCLKELGVVLINGVSGLCTELDRLRQESQNS
jgi:DNA-binding transcriptional MerR regulator/methylmalonyl-CoA mutase cobalamin-binding subunit